MAQEKLTPRNPSLLERRLAAYGSMSMALAAVCMPGTARADIVTYFTGPGNITTSAGSDGAVYFNLLSGAVGKNGANGFSATSMDFELLTTGSSTGGDRKARFLVGPESHLLTNSNAFVRSASLLFGGGSNSIAKLGYGAKIGPNLNLVFSNALGTLAQSSSPQFGHWNQKPALGNLGLVIQEGASPIYGWASIQVNTDYTITLLEFGRDSSGATITSGGAPEPSSIVLLALGAAGIAAWRRKKQRGTGL